MKIRLKFWVIVLCSCICSTYISKAQIAVELSTNTNEITNSLNIDVKAEFSEGIQELKADDFELVNGQVTAIENIQNIEFSKAHFVSEGLARSKISFGEASYFISNISSNTINVYDLDGQLTNQIGSPNDEIEFLSLQSMDILNDTIYAIDDANFRVVLITADGSFISEIKVDENFFMNDLKVSNDKIFIGGSTEVKIFDKYGSKLSSFEINQNCRAIDIYENKLFIWNEAGGEISVYDDSGLFLYYIHLSFDSGSRPGDFTINEKGDLFIVRRDHLSIYDKNGILKSNILIDESINTPEGIALNTDSTVVVTNHDTDNLVYFKFSDMDSSYNISLKPLAEGILNIFLAEGRVLSNSGQINNQSNLIELIYDGTNPLAEITSSLSAITEVTPLIYDISLSEQEDQFNLGDIKITEPYLGVDFSGDGINFRLKVWPAANQVYSVSIADSVFLDLAGNFNEASNEISIEYQSDRPEVQMQFDQEYATDTIVNIEVQFNELVTGLTKEDFLISNAEILNDLSETDTYRNLNIQLKPDLFYQNISIGIRDSAVLSLSGGYSFPSNIIQFIYDVSKPNIFLSAPAATQSSTFDFELTVLNNERESNEELLLELNDIMVTNGSISFFRRTGATFSNQYEGIIEGNENSIIEIFIPENSVFDNAGNGNDQAQYKIITDNISPEFIISSDRDVYTSNIVPVKVSLSEIVNRTMRKSDFSITGGSIVGFEQDSLEALLDVKFDVDSNKIELSIVSNFADLAGNTFNSNSIVLYYDPNPLEIHTSSTVNEFISSKEINEFDLTFMLSDSVINFDANDLNVFGVDLNTFSKVNDTLYIANFTIESLDEVLVEVSINPNRLFKSNGLSNDKIEYFIIVDRTRPTANITIDNTNGQIEEELVVNIVFDDPVYNFFIDPIFCLAFESECFTQNDIEIQGGRVSNFRGNIDRFTFDLIPNEPQIELFIPENVAYNIVDFGNVASEVLRLNYSKGEIIVSNGLDDSSDSNFKYFIDEQRVLNIDLPSQYKGSRLSIFDLNGNERLNQYLDSESHEIVLDQYLNGIYVLLLWKENEIISSSKFIIND